MRPIRATSSNSPTSPISPMMMIGGGQGGVKGGQDSPSAGL